ncbi:hypothetical protein SARC_05232 [Sphaeroforma arctica JP610]|uniref:Uncharacterized protein n=1 Tax=Sphaeroforma arctica JP610 TaxID=667725 RepID=A0A0L0G083_9EUKA|nr:hypothetical protein SARC_05232 [Sphaeroforma arctica JP610]KNC82480.1 hypothetical protein SARC_05232 [Sphaeroforma arctica JP610]|eukprot:XP_014156382.1 hypothetical protein SARC_05232 [Sphaeroforma arctica JP610]
MQVTGPPNPGDSGTLTPYTDPHPVQPNVAVPGSMTVGGRSSKFFGCALCNKFRPSKRSYNAERHIWVKHISQTVVEGLSDSDPRPPYNAAKHKALVYRHQKKFFNVQPDIEPNLVAQRSFSQADQVARGQGPPEFKQPEQNLWAVPPEQQAQPTQPVPEQWNGYYDNPVDPSMKKGEQPRDATGSYSGAFSSWDPVYQRREGDFAKGNDFSSNQGYPQSTSPRYNSMPQRDYAGWPADTQASGYDQWAPQQGNYLVHENGAALSQGTLPQGPQGAYTQQTGAYGGPQAFAGQHQAYGGYGVQQAGPGTTGQQQPYGYNQHMY